MDEQTKKVGIEILGAGADQMEGSEPTGWDEVAFGLLAYAEALIHISMESESPTALQPPRTLLPPTMRKLVAAQLHRYAVDAVQSGGEVAVAALVLSGKPVDAALAEIGDRLKSGFRGDQALGTDGADELAVAHQHYVFAASALSSLISDPEHGTFLGFLESVLASVGAVVQAAAGARADGSYGA